MVHTFQDLLANFANEIFVGREEHLSLFENALSSSRPPFLILSISGQGGVGKTTLLEQLRRVADNNVITSLVNEGQTTVPAVLAHFAYQFKEAGHPLKAFEKRFHKYQELKGQVEADPKAPKGILDFTLRSAARISLRSLKRIPIAGETAEVLLNPEVEDFVADQVSAIAIYLGQKFSNEDERVLLLETNQELTRYFLNDLNNYSKQQRIILFFDTFEKTAPYLDHWLRDLLIGNYGSFSGNVLFVIAGRYPLDQDWIQFKPAMRQIELQEFTESEARKYLENFGITDENEVAEMLKLSNRLPILLALLSSFPTSFSNNNEVSEDAVERFLRGTSKEQQKIALVSCVPRFFNLDILKHILNSESTEVSFDWLSHSHFVQSTMEGWAYHDIVRSLMLRYFRLRSTQKCLEIHRDLAKFYNHLAEKLEIAEDKQLKDETLRKYKIENLYHSLCHAPQKNLSSALNGFIAAWKVERAFARVWIDTIRQAGEDGQNEEVQLWSKRLISGFEANGYQSVIDMCTHLINNTNLEAQWLSDTLKKRSYFYTLAGEYSKALADIDKALEIAPEESEHWVAKVIVYQSMKSYEEALATLDYAIKMKPDDKLLASFRMFVLLKMGDINSAASEVSDFYTLLRSREFDRFADSSLSPTSNLMRISPQDEQKILFLFQKLGFDEDLLLNAARMFEISFTNDPESTFIDMKASIENIGDLSRQNPEILKFIELIGKTVDMEGVKNMEQDNPDVLPLTRIFGEGTNWDAMFSTLNPGQTGNWSELNNISQNTLLVENILEGEFHLRKMEYDKAIAAYSKILDSGNLIPRILVRRGEAYRMKNQYEISIVDFDQAIELDPTFEFGLKRRGETFLLMGKYEEALADTNHLLAIDPENDWAFYQRGLVYLLSDKIDEAELNLNEAIHIATKVYKQNPKDWNNTFDLMFYYLAANLPDNAEDLCLQALSATVSNHIVVEASLLLELFLRLFPNHLGASNINNKLEEYLLNSKEEDISTRW